MTLLIRADASTQIGAGHVMRCLALAQAWQESGGRALFVMAMEAPALQARLAAEGMDVAGLAALPGSPDDAAQTAALAREDGASWVVVDGYHFDDAYQKAIKAAGLRLLCVDDYGHARHYYADLVLNQNIHAGESLYTHREPYTRLLLGTRYALLRREFWSWRGWRREIPPVAHKTLVTLGGGDPDNQTLKVIRALQQVGVDGLESVVVVGASNPHFQELRSAIRNSRFTIRLVRNATNMPELMEWADVAISAGGSTCWELAFMGLPHLILMLAENQRPIAEGLAAAGAALNLGWYRDVSVGMLANALARLLSSSQERAGMAQRGQQLVDGEGTRRVVAIMFQQAHLRVRPATFADMERLFAWANDPLTRQMSFHSEPIPWETHQRWFNKVLNTPETLLMIVELEEDVWAPVGQVRIDPDGTVSISIAPQYRGRGLAAPALEAAVEYHNTRFNKSLLTAYIKPENRPSQKAFVRAEFEFGGESEVSGQRCLKYVYRNEPTG